MPNDGMKGKRDVYVAGIGSYSPGEPIPFERIEDVLGRITQAPPKLLRWIDRMRPIMKEMLGVEYCHYAIDPKTRQPTDDNVTMSVKSAEKALAMAGMKPTDIDLLVYAGIMMEYICPPTTTLIQEELKVPECAEYAIHSNCTSIYKALQLAVDQISLGRYKNALIMTSQLSSPFLRTEHLNEKLLRKPQILLRWFLSDGAGALVATSDSNAGQKRLRVVETYIESMGLGLGPDMYCRVGGHRVNPLETYEKGWHHLTQNFDQVAKLGVELAKKAGDRMLDRVGVDLQEVKYMFMNVPTRHIYDQVVSDVKRDKNVPNLQFYSKLADRGYPGPCAIIHALDGFLQETTPDKGDILASVVAESSKWMYGGFVLEYVG
ncbi:MAG: 3-oxoacyl-ACP synthase III family protein [Acidobacteriota bacterium]